eukprot:CAMPEP_0115010562 /NCGR_PEP_ID=MMETSP0216-20121206/23394_1 /TAXON_ID=223996 /ORGANISM="Protocruzia adherens, Strain Boccale" /LENGTH=344 /DNA_ID=CAMNT_0002378809 /DNA_START=567 /DNA_END=1601 /DNA_ORIENTATION=+
MEPQLFTSESIPFWQYDQDSATWVPSTLSEDVNRPLTKSFKISTINVLHDIPWVKFFHGHFTYDLERYRAIGDHLEQLESDVICLNECTQSCLQLLESMEWVQRGYFISETVDNQCVSFGKGGSGNLIMTKVPFQQLRMLKLTRLTERPIIFGKFLVENNGSLLVGSAHLTAIQSKHAIRREELNRVYEFLDTSNFCDCDHTLILGDLNFHREDENSTIRSDFEDLWMAMYDLKENPGYTWDSHANPLIEQRFPLGFETRRMRLDRILYKSKTTIPRLNVKTLQIFAEKPLYEPDRPHPRMNMGIFKAFVTQLADLFGRSPFRRKEDYLFCSDHFGLTAQFEGV